MIKASTYKAPDNLLKDKVILISGGGSGIGREAGLTFSSFGAETILLGKDPSNLEETYSLYEKNNLKKPILQVIDLETAQEEDFKKISNEVLKEFGKLDGLLNNAGILGTKTSIQNYDLEEWRRVSKVNFESALLLTRSLFPVLQIPDNSSVVFTSSGVGKRDEPIGELMLFLNLLLKGWYKFLVKSLKRHPVLE
ncbi:MAG: hypothetical protein CM1200mP12_11570 [Gammaproteobacteria bacterium]|nr:MAG: hypothetical protein CM1200mP12_11570 [Gammaproteobacteria bacterium]